ncbi:MAG: class I tRNA ligase family protein [Candidatus Pacebacteria bacterium]|nr:class I tRNA ligase family protein [Candidatus Paceibacterota bacterium]
MYDFKETESRVSKFWADHSIFEKSLELRRKGKRFVFWEGPPTANGLPHTGHFLTRIYKDVYGRYKTMRGFFVSRKAGWDTHGLPVEIEIEKELGFNNKKQVEEYGIAKFNRKARQSVWKYTHEWEEMTRKMGFWLDLDHPYVTYENNYMESVWSILKTVSDKGLLYQAHKVVPFCARCGTPLSAHEVAQGYKTVKDTSVYLKFKVKDQENTFILAWTTTPWTLPGNVALAVGAEVNYVYVQKDGETLILAKDLLEKILGEGNAIDKEVPGSELVGMEYESLFDVPELKSENSYKVYPADFVTTTDGTGVVHTAVMYGEDDYVLGTKLNLPKVHTVNEQGHFIDSIGDGLAGKYVKSKGTEDLIIEKLKERNQLFKVEEYEHEYPFCWRCNTPLLYYAKTAWFIRTSAINKELLANNATVNWKPEHVKDGRFGQWIKEGRDWTLSRERYWGTPLPIWECVQCDHKTTIGSIKELEKLSIGQKNTYYVMRHSLSTRNEAGTNIVSSHLESDKYHLTEEGKGMVERSLELLKLDGVDAIYSSPFLRTKETAEIAGKVLHHTVEVDARLSEIDRPIEFEGQTPAEGMEKESDESIRTRLAEFIKEIETKHKNKKILIVTHMRPMYLLQAIAGGYSSAELKNKDGLNFSLPNLAEIRKLEWRNIPRNEYGELDLHRPFIDEVVIKCTQCKSKMRKIPDLIDVWFDSGAMPYAQWHYPFENKDVFKKQFPADFIVEGMDQTRGWFWSLLGIATLLGYGAPYKNVMALGFTLDSKGVKESKSKGNYVPILEFMGQHGSDVLRWYFASTMTAGENKSVIPREIDDKLKGFFFTLQNCLRFYELYAAEEKGEIAKLTTLDKWLMSRLYRTIDTVTNSLDTYDVVVAGRALEQFVAEDLSNWWLRRSRRRKEALPLLRSVLIEVSKLIAPFTPFMAEDSYRRMGGELESVHLADWPKVQKKYIDDKLEAEMVNARAVIAAGLAERKNKQFKVRQPLSSVTIKNGKFSRDLEGLIKEELNVKKVEYNKEQETEVVLDLVLTPALTREGYARELMRQIQDMRKEAKYQMDESVMVDWHSEDSEVVSAITEWSDAIKADTVLKTLEQKEKHGLYDIEKESELAPSKKIWLGIKK